MAKAILKGEKVTLRPLRVEDVPLQTKWFLDPEVVRWLQLSEDPPEWITEEAVQERFELMEADPFTREWAIQTEEGKTIGSIELVNIHGLQGRAEMHLVIGEKEYWSGGYGSDAIQTLLRYAFLELDLRRVWLTPDADNERARRTFEKCGFKQEGLLREHRLRFGKPVDMLVMGVLRDEFLKGEL